MKLGLITTYILGGLLLWIGLACSFSKSNDVGTAITGGFALTLFVMVLAINIALNIAYYSHKKTVIKNNEISYAAITKATVTPAYPPELNQAQPTDQNPEQ